MANFKGRYCHARKRTGEALQAVLFHKILIALVFIDATLVIIDLGYNVIHPDCRRPGERSGQPEWLEVLSHISLGITALFLVEIPLTLWSLGFQWYNPWSRVAHSWLHLFDATVIVATFVLEVVLRGQDSEFAALLIILRLWRIVKLVAGVTVGIEEMDEEQANAFIETKGELARTKAELATAQQQVEALQRRLNTQVNDTSSAYSTKGRSD